MNALFLRDLAVKIRRGQSGRILNGYAAGGLSYGYRVVKKLDESGEPIRGLREIDEDQAHVVRRIFQEFAVGRSARAIAADLNKEGTRLHPTSRATVRARGHPVVSKVSWLLHRNISVPSRLFGPRTRILHVTVG
ncbi:recombinase family protein [Mesorhizobium sp. B1-1-9]|uniref:recombinase family protein n=1 Tax=Mesorhizobium sp. B1-1-9 TaxID=2589975 RepID=UPI0032B1DC7C